MAIEFRYGYYGRTPLEQLVVRAFEECFFSEQVDLLATVWRRTQRASNHLGRNIKNLAVVVPYLWTMISTIPPAARTSQTIGRPS
jgi:hypothetical protein